MVVCGVDGNDCFACQENGGPLWRLAAGVRAVAVSSFLVAGLVLVVHTILIVAASIIRVIISSSRSSSSSSSRPNTSPKMWPAPGEYLCWMRRTEDTGPSGLPHML